MLKIAAGAMTTGVIDTGESAKLCWLHVERTAFTSFLFRYCVCHPPSHLHGLSLSLSCYVSLLCGPPTLYITGGVGVNPAVYVRYWLLSFPLYRQKSMYNRYLLGEENPTLSTTIQYFSFQGLI